MGIAHIALPFEELAEPGQPDLKNILALVCGSFLVTPVGGDPVFSRPMHLLGPDLDFKGNTPVAYNRGVEGLIAIALGHGDVVAKTPGNGLIKLVDQAQDGIAFADCGHDNPGGKEVVDLIQLLVLDLHLPVDAVKMFGPAFDLSRNPHGRNLEGQFFRDLAQILFPIRPPLRQHTPQLIVGIGIQITKTQVFQLPLDPVDTQAGRQGGIDIQGLPGRCHLLVRLLEFHGPHIVEAVGQLDQDHPDVPGHGQEHLAEILGLHLLLGGIGNP